MAVTPDDNITTITSNISKENDMSEFRIEAAPVVPGDLRPVGWTKEGAPLWRLGETPFVSPWAIVVSPADSPMRAWELPTPDYEFRRQPLPFGCAVFWPDVPPLLSEVEDWRAWSLYADMFDPFSGEWTDWAPAEGGSVMYWEGLALAPRGGTVRTADVLGDTPPSSETGGISAIVARAEKARDHIQESLRKQFDAELAAEAVELFDLYYRRLRQWLA